MISSLALDSQIQFKCVLPIRFPLLQIFCASASLFSEPASSVLKAGTEEEMAHAEHYLLQNYLF